MSDVYGAGIDQAKLFQTISLAVADTTKEVLEGEQANRVRELQAEVERLKDAIREHRDSFSKDMDEHDWTTEDEALWALVEEVRDE